MAWPCGTEILSVIDFLPRFAELKYAESLVSRPLRSLIHGGPKARESSPRPGRSTLITSAPRSARFWLAQGAASTRDKSRTRMCERGPATRPPEKERLEFSATKALRASSRPSHRARPRARHAAA